MVGAEIRRTCEAYIGRERLAGDSMAREPAAKLATVLERPLTGTLPATWHWAYFNQAVPPGDTGRDGHEKPGLFLPPVPFERRMWAAGEVVVFQPLRVGVPAEKRSVIEDVAFKTGRTGALCFVTLRHDITQGARLALSEAQTIVYRDRGLDEPPLRQPDDPVPEGYRVFPDTLLQAYSAITQNGHRIHWDRDFCRDVEGYPGLVVHGPLLATVLADALFEAPGPCRFSYRATAPVFETSPVRVVREPGGRARIERSDGIVAMTAAATPVSVSG